MRIKSSGVVVEILGQNIILNPYAINDVHEFINRCSFNHRYIWFAMDKGGQLYCYNHEPINYIDETEFLCGNRDNEHCESLMHLDVEWNYDLEWMGAQKAILVEDIKRMITDYYEQNGNI